MSSIIEGYNYDIFISYRQKDNIHDGWVTEFVENLKGELESTFKEEISVYFDINPHDGLLETHDVDESLKEKLKCLIFIPIISRTYCDPKVFAWEHEFKAFVEQALKDEVGLKVRLPNSNVASRVLPIVIYDLDKQDIKLCESILGGVLRGVEFTYKTAGVNRPLNVHEDHPQDNLNKIYYRDQINKVANSIQEIIQGIKATSAPVMKEKPVISEALEEVRKEERKAVIKKHVKLNRLLSAAVIVAILIVAGVLAYPKIFKSDRLEFFRSKGEISVAILPFQNMTNDTSKNFWQMMIQDNLITSLSNTEELKVRQFELITSLLQNDNITNYASITPSIASNVSQRLDANVFVHGSINQIGSTIRLNARLIDSETQEVYRSFQIEGTEENILHLSDSLSRLVNDFLLVTILQKQLRAGAIGLALTNSPEAYRNFLNGENAFSKRDYSTARNWYLQALDTDSNFNAASRIIALTYLQQGIYDQAKKWALDLYSKRDQSPSVYDKLRTNFIYARLFETPVEQIKYSQQILELDDKNELAINDLGNSYLLLYLYDKAIIEYEKYLELNEKWNTKPFAVFTYNSLGRAYHATGQFKKERRLYKKAEVDFPNDSAVIRRQAILALSEGKSKAANEYMEKFISISKDNSVSEVDITTTLAGIYSEADIRDKAEEYYRQALSLEPENQNRINVLAYFLIDKELNISEGLELIDKALAVDPEDYGYLHTQGWGLYKNGAYQEALETLQKSWDIRREEAIYDHQAYLHLEEARKAVVEYETFRLNRLIELIVTFYEGRPFANSLCF